MSQIRNLSTVPSDQFQLPTPISSLPVPGTTPDIRTTVPMVPSVPTVRPPLSTTVRSLLNRRTVRSPAPLTTPAHGSVPAGYTSLEEDAPSRRDNSYQRFLTEFTQAKYQDMVKEPEDAYVHENTLGLDWTNPQAAQRAHSVTIALNRPPDAVNPNAKGIAIWQRPSAKTGGFWHSYEIRDDIVSHLKPVLHGDYFIVRWYRTLKAKTAKRLSLITHSTWYEPTTGVVAAECHFLGAALVTFSVIKMIDMGYTDIPDGRHTYDQLIGMVAKEFGEANKMRNVRDAHTPIHDILERFVMSSD